jgi:hypothetical protein
LEDDEEPFLQQKYKKFKSNKMVKNVNNSIAACSESEKDDDYQDDEDDDEEFDMCVCKAKTEGEAAAENGGLQETKHGTPLVDKP